VGRLVGERVGLWKKRSSWKGWVSCCSWGVGGRGYGVIVVDDDRGWVEVKGCRCGRESECGGGMNSCFRRGVSNMD
jgi:hypothetical protein